MKKIILIFFIIFLFTKNIYASDYISEGIDMLNLEEYDTIISNNTQSDIKFSDIAKDILSGDGLNFNIGTILNYIVQAVFDEIFINSNIIKNIVLIAILGAFFKVISENFKNKNVSEIGFYATYMIIAILLSTSFNISINILLETIEKIENIINGLMPILTGVLIMSGASGSSGIFSGFILMALKLLSFFIRNIFVGIISTIVILTIINYITPKEVMNKLINFLKWLANISLRGLAIVLTFIISLQRIGVPILNGVLNKTAKTFVSFIPVVGDAMTSAIDSIMSFAQMLKSGVSISVLIVIVICASVPIIKLISIIFIYKITAILIEPITDSRITNCVDTMGEYTKTLLSALVIFLMLFIFFLTIMLTITV